MSVLVSVVVPTYYREELLDRCLAALAVQDLDPRSYEIIVADDGPSESTERLVHCKAAVLDRLGPQIRYVPVTATQGPAGARNAGWKAAAGPLIAFTDDDCLPAADWLRSGLAAMRPGVDAAWGRVVVPVPSRPTDYQRDAGRLANAGFVTANCFLRRETLEVLGGFDERFTAAWREDSDLYFSLLERGSRVVRVPEAVVLHPVRPAPWGISLRQQRKTAFNALLFKKHPHFYRCHIRRTPWNYYATAATLAATGVSLAAGWGTLAWAGLGVWTALTAWFCVSRLRGTSLAPSHVAEMVVTSALIPWLSLYWKLHGAIRYRVLFV